MYDFLLSILFPFLCLLPIKRNKVLLTDYYGYRYGCNPKYISQALSRYKDIDIVWGFIDSSKHPEYTEGRSVKWGSFRFLYELATSRVFVTNFRMPLWYHSRKEQVYIQTWHSSLRLKMIEKDTEATLPLHYIKMAKHDSAQTDFVIAGCEKSADTFKNSFWFDGQILRIGTPRNDFLINADRKKIFEIKQTLGIHYDTKVFLYAPTFREDKSTQYYDLDFDILKEVLANNFGGNWKIMIRLHPHLSGCAIFQNRQDLIDVTKYDDIQELLLISDVLLTDYSSLMFDFGITGKPVFLYTPDLETYCFKERALYFDIKELPFPFALTQDSLLCNIENFDYKEYSDKVDLFNGSTGNFEKGTASKSVCDLILKYVNI